MTPITLNRLERPEVETMVGHLAGDRSLPGEVVDHINGGAQGRISYRRIKLSFALDNDGLEELRRELIGLKRLAADVDGELLVWEPDGRRGPTRAHGAAATVAGLAAR